MENASKALLIAGGILILIILVSLILIVRNNVTNFYASQDELQMTTDRAKFNEQFTRYNRDDVEGYELISLANKVIDYNERVSSATTEGNNDQSEPIKLSISLWKDNTEKGKVAMLLGYDDTLRLFDSDSTSYKLIEDQTSSNSVALNKGSNWKLKDILAQAKTIKTNCSKIDVLVKKINSIILKNLKRSPESISTSSWKPNITLTDIQKEEDRKSMLGALSVYESVTNDTTYKPSESNSKTWSGVGGKYRMMLYDNIYGDKTNGNNNKTYMLKYYEYIQFTKAKFKCTKMDYSPSTGRVTNLEFKFTGEIE